MSTSPQATVEEFFSRNASGEPPERIAELVSQDVDWYVAGNVNVVSWIGRKEGRAGVAEFYRELRQQVISEKFEIADMLISGNRVVVLGELASRVRNTGKLIQTEFAFDFTVDDGQIVRFRLFEDSCAVALAVAPTGDI
jgi:ketosteroid isomerase-like protein